MITTSIDRALNIYRIKKTRLIFIVLMTILLTSCKTLAPGSRPYTPADQQEREILTISVRKVFPDDVRANPEKYNQTVLAWTGILDKAEWLDADQTRAKFTIKHHYWDWIEDYSVQKAVAFMSPRGEGTFNCIRSSSAKGSVLPKIGSMAITYGIPLQVSSENGEITLDCKTITFAAENWYRTDIWDYGRKFLLNGDGADFKILRVPLY